VRGVVTPSLRPYVASLVPYDVDLGGPGTHVGMPSTTLTLVLPLDEVLDVSWAGRPESRTASWSSVSGMHTAPAEIRHGGTQRGVQLALTVAGARALLGLPAAALAGELLTLDDLRDTAPDLRHLPERLAGTAGWADRVRLVERALVAALARDGAPGPRAEVGRALARLTGGARVADVAEEVGWSRRHLATMVRAEAGVTPKAWHRLARFERGHRLLRTAAAQGRPSLAGVAAEAGYADQAHLTREWSELAGCTPSRWLAEEFPFVQDIPAGDDAP
jgi:AraC-like DNA-binding protein